MTNEEYNVKDENYFESNAKREYSSRSPLRYPGGKTRAIKAITRYFPKNLEKLVSPFIGGGSIELFLAAKGIEVFGYDIHGPLIDFWNCVLKHPHKLSYEIERYYPLTKKRFYSLQNNITSYDSKFTRAAIYYALNQSSFSGLTLSGGMSPMHPRFTMKRIKALRKFYNPLLHVERLDFKESLLRHPNVFAYLDPPYLNHHLLYGKYGDIHKAFDHEGLFKILKSRRNWILSYNDCKEIRAMYKEFRIVKLNWKYGMGKNTDGKEVLIFSSDLKIDLNLAS